jgi:hypothetical protein
MTKFAAATAPHSNHTDWNPKVLSKRVAYVAAHREYFDYLHLLLDRAALPHCDVYLPNLTTMAAMVHELRKLNPTVPWLNAVVLGRLLNRILPNLLTWHGGRHSGWQLPCRTHVLVETTVYRFPEVQRAKLASEQFVGIGIEWSNNLDQWQTNQYLSEDGELSDYLQIAQSESSSLPWRNAGL